MGNPLKEKSIQFAIKVIKTTKFLKSKKEYTLSDQLLRSGTSIGANMEEALGAHSKKEFVSKLAISYKEARESRYWLLLLKETGYINKNTYSILETDCEELCKILTSTIKTTKANMLQ